MFSPREILDIAIRIEQNAEASYRNAAATAGNPAISVALQCMAEEEASHAKLFRDLREKLSTASGNPIMEEMSRSLLEDLLGKKCFALDALETDPVDDLEQLVSISLEFENDTILFYQMIRKFIQDEVARNQVAVIIEEEKAHIEQLKKMQTKPEKVEA